MFSTVRPSGPIFTKLEQRLYKHKTWPTTYLQHFFSELFLYLMLVGAVALSLNQCWRVPSSDNYEYLVNLFSLRIGTEGAECAIVGGKKLCYHDKTKIKLNPLSILCSKEKVSVSWLVMNIPASRNQQIIHIRVGGNNRYCGFGSPQWLRCMPSSLRK